MKESFSQSISSVFSGDLQAIWKVVSAFSGLFSQTVTGFGGLATPQHSYSTIFPFVGPGLRDPLPLGGWRILLLFPPSHHLLFFRLFLQSYVALAAVHCDFLIDGSLQLSFEILGYLCHLAVARSPEPLRLCGSSVFT